MAGDCAGLAELLGIPFVADQRALVREVRRELSGRERFLIVFEVMPAA